MNILEMAEEDLAMTLEDSEKGFGREALITNPAGVSANLNIQSGDVHLLFDPNTGVPVNNRTIHASIRSSSLENAGLGIPKATPDENENPWVFAFADNDGNTKKTTVSISMFDRTLGVVTVILELMTDAT